MAQIDIPLRERNKLYVMSALNWMKNAFSQHPDDLKDMVNNADQAFSDVVKSYEEEIECLKRALPADSNIQTNSLPVPADSVED